MAAETGSQNRSGVEASRLSLTALRDLLDGLEQELAFVGGLVPIFAQALGNELNGAMQAKQEGSR